MEKSTVLSVAAAAALVCGSAHADILNFRDWLDANPATPNATTHEWYGTIGLGGPLMTSQGTYWNSPGYPVNTPQLASRTSVGSDSGSAGPSTFEGSWVHPGSGVPAVLVFSPTVPTWIGGMSVHSELIVNGLLGNGITITVYSTIGGDTTSHGTTILAGTSTDRLDDFYLPSVTLFSPGDSLAVAFGDNGSYLYDHVNFNAWITIPTPGAAAVLGLGGLLGARRRR